MAAPVADEMLLTNIRHNLTTVLEKIAQAAHARSQELQSLSPRLVAVSKTKPAAAVLEAYKAGQRHFGENYVQELVDKANDSTILQQCSDIKWHFIGHLQSNKINKVLSAKNLYMIETVDSEKLAHGLNQSLDRLGMAHLAIMLQVNTSNEDNKSGCAVDKVCDLAEYVHHSCPRLRTIGLMTIGAFDHDLNSGPNPDFQKLITCRREVSERLRVGEYDLELSMGMSGDYEHAISVGSSSVRVGSLIFGERQVKPTSQHQPAPSSQHQSVPTSIH